MDPTQLIKAAPAIAKGAEALAAAIPFTAVVKRMLGPAADELAETWRDQVRLYRYQRQLKCVEKAERMAQDAGFTPQAVPPKILFPLLEGASFEENENLHDMWAALLANSASPENAGKVRPGFIAILRQMGFDEAAVLNWMYHHHMTFHNPTPGESIVMFPVSYDQIGLTALPKAQLETTLDGLEAAQLIREDEPQLNRFNSTQLRFLGEGRRYVLTARGVDFIAACQPPAPIPKS